MKKELSVFKHYRRFGKITEQNETYKTVKFEYKGQKYTVYSIKKPIKRSTIIHCENDGTIYREQLYPCGKDPCSVKSSLIKPVRQGDETVIVLFSGKPNFRNLDAFIFISAKNKSPSTQSIYVMTKTAFKRL